jgi:hypothetical protein
LVTTVIGVGDGSLAAIGKFCAATRRPVPDQPIGSLKDGQVHLLTRDGPIEVIAPRKPKERQKRHARKYAEGELGEDRSFSSAAQSPR